MSVFKTFFGITKSNLKVLCIYFAVSIGMSILLSGSGSPANEIFSDEKIKVAVVDNDNSDASKALYSYFEKTQDIVEASDDIDQLQDQLFFEKVQYYVVIPEGFGQSLMDNGDVKLQVTTAPNSYKGAYIDMQVQEFVKQYRGYSLLDLDEDTVVEKTLENMAIVTETETYFEEDASTKVPGFYSFFLYMGYGFTAVMCHAIGSILVAFNKEDVVKRMNCSALPVEKRNLFMALGSLIIMVIVWVVYNIIAILFKGEELLSNPMYGWFLLVSFIYALVCLAFGFLAGTVSKNDGHISMFSVSLSMVLSFLGGIFVSLDYLSETVAKFSKFLPTYWYVNGLNKLIASTRMTDKLAAEIAQGIGIQIIYAAAIIAVAFLISRTKASGKAA